MEPHTTHTQKNRMSQAEVEAWSSHLNIAVAAATTLAGVLAFAALAFSNWAGRLKDAAFEKHRIDSAERTATLEKEAAVARLDLAKLQSSVSPRRLTEDQQKEIGLSLSRFSGLNVPIWYGTGDKEAETFAWEIAATLNSAGWQVLEPASKLIFKKAGAQFNPKGSRLQTGVTVCHRGHPMGKEAADALVDELSKHGFDAMTRQDGENTEGALVIVDVEARPSGSQGIAKARTPRK